MTELYELRCDAVAGDLRVLSFRGREAINEPYQFCIGALTRDGADVDMDAVIDAAATLSIAAPGHDEPQVFHGVIASVEHVHELEGRAVLELTLVPRLFRLTQTHHSRVFVDKAAPEIIGDILALNGIDDVRMALRGSYPTMPFVCQYRESDLAFITRWMEREGMHYFFEQGEAGETLVIADDRSAHYALAVRPVRFVPASAGDTGVGEALTYLRGRSRMLPSNVTVRDYDYDNPKLDVRGAADVSSRGGGEIHLHGQNFTSPGEGQRLAKIRAQELLSRQKTFEGHGRVFQLRPGYTFTVEEHPRASFNAGYLVTELEHHGNQAAEIASLRDLLGVEHADEYRIDVRAVPAAVAFRPERSTPWPRIYGTENGVIDGPATSDYAQIDTSGCYKVKIDFDETALSGGGASCWLRMLQPHGGGNEGFHFPLRAGTEVLLTFLGGDPDQPVISGVLPNALKQSPVAASNHTMNVLQTGGLNRMEMEDLDGKQHVRISTPTENTSVHLGAPVDGYNVDVLTDGDARLKCGRTYDVRVGSDHDKHVVGEVTRTYDKSEETLIRQNRFKRIDGSDDTTIGGPQTTTVDGDVSEKYKSDFQNSIDGKSYREVGAGAYSEDIEAGGNVKEKTAGSWDIEISGNENRHVLGHHKSYLGSSLVHTRGNARLSVKGDYTRDIHGDTTDIYRGLKKEEYKKEVEEWFWGRKTDLFMGLSSSTFIGLKNYNMIGGSVSTTVAAKVDVALAASMEFTASAKLTATASSSLELTPARTTKREMNSEGNIVRMAKTEILGTNENQSTHTISGVKIYK